jgi:hypothetical protein
MVRLHGAITLKERQYRCSGVRLSGSRGCLAGSIRGTGAAMMLSSLRLAVGDNFFLTKITSSRKFRTQVGPVALINLYTISIGNQASHGSVAQLVSA